MQFFILIAFYPTFLENIFADTDINNQQTKMSAFPVNKALAHAYVKHNISISTMKIKTFFAFQKCIKFRIHFRSPMVKFNKYTCVVIPKMYGRNGLYAFRTNCNDVVFTDIIHD